jgi:toxin ParE1/3/4
MSSRNPTPIVSPRAEQDIEDIVLRSLLTWGPEQARAYEEALERAIEDLGIYPHLGRERPELPATYRSYPVKEHVIYYRSDGRKVTVVRVLHAKMDASGHL